ncbi:MAG: cytochrome c [Bacteroidota bacterium]
MYYRIFILVAVSFLTFQCQEKETKQDFSFAKKEKPDRILASKLVNLENKGIGPIDSVHIGAVIDAELASEGKALYEQKCNACHKVGTTFIGPPPNGILKRRTPEWVMNMILNTEEMIQKDSLAQALFMEFNGQLMTNQNVTEQEARAMLEYFRTLEE